MLVNPMHIFMCGVGNRWEELESITREVARPLIGLLNRHLGVPVFSVPIKIGFQPCSYSAGNNICDLEPRVLRLRGGLHEARVDDVPINSHISRGICEPPIFSADRRESCNISDKIVVPEAFSMFENDTSGWRGEPTLFSRIPTKPRNALKEQANRIIVQSSALCLKDFRSGDFSLVNENADETEILLVDLMISADAPFMRHVGEMEEVLWLLAYCRADSGCEVANSILLVGEAHHSGHDEPIGTPLIGRVAEHETFVPGFIDKDSKAVVYH